MTPNHCWDLLPAIVVHYGPVYNGPKLLSWAIKTNDKTIAANPHMEQSTSATQDACLYIRQLIDNICAIMSYCGTKTLHTY